MKIRFCAFIAFSILVLACKPRPPAPTFSFSKSKNAEPETTEPDIEQIGEGEEGELGDGEIGEGETTTGEPMVGEKTTDPTTTDPTPEDPNKKLEIKISGRQLLVDGKPFHMKGVCYAPVAKGATQSKGPIFSNPTDNDLKALEKDFQMMTDAGINTIRTYNVIENDKVLALLNKYGIFVIVPVLSGWDVKMDEVKRIVNKLKNHRSTLMWQVGNEWNYNLLYGAANFDTAKNIVKQAGAAIKSVDRSIPTATDWGEMVDAKLVQELSDYDIWGLNIYQGKSFGDHFNKYKAISNKPLYIGEFGADAFNRKINGYDPNSQGIATEQLVKELDDNLSAVKADNAAIGGTIFEWNDEWWKDNKGRPDVHDTGGIAPGGGPYPDAEFNEEWWGVVDIDRNPRPAYEKLKAQWKK